MNRRVKVLATAAAVLTAYAAGTVTGAVTTGGSGSGRAAGQSVLDQAERTIASRAARPVSPSVLQAAAVQGMLKALGDRWSTYYSPNDFSHFQQVLSGTYTGVGVWVRRVPSGALRLSSVEPHSPAADAGLRAGDVLVAVDGRAVAGRSVADVVSGLRGAPGSAVSVSVRRGGTAVTTRLDRSRIADDDVSASMIGSRIERLRIAAFTRGVGAWVRRQVARAQQRHDAGMVLDLRDDPGGLLDEAVETASAFLSGGAVVSYVTRGQPPQQLDALGAGDTALPLVVLVDGGTASAAEIVAGALQDRGRAVLVGSRTFGKGSVQQPASLSDGSAIELTVGHYLTPNGRSLDGTGLTPDVLVPASTPESVVDTRAVQVLSGLTADAGSPGRG